MKIRKTRKKYGSVHRGFFAGFSDVSTEVFKVISRARALGKKLYLAGHSLGGALASVAAADAYHELGAFEVEGIYTYGMPKTCNRKCANYINAVFGRNFFRFVNDKDIVARIPPGSRHVGQLYHFNNSGNLPSNEESLEAVGADADYAPLSEAEFASLQKAFEDGNEGLLGVPVKAAKDHGIDNYIKAIEKQV